MAKKKKTDELIEDVTNQQTAEAETADNVIDMVGTGQPDANGAINGFDVLDEVIGVEEIQKANQILLKYKQGKANLEARIIENEQWYKLRHWDYIKQRKKDGDVLPTSAWLFNALANKHADAMDNFPAPNILPREEGDRAEAKKLTSIVPVILDQCDFEQVYSDVWQYKLKSGTGVYGVYWDKSKLNGLGDISIEKVDLLMLFWEPGISDIQKSKNLFHIDLVGNEELEGAYPQLKGKLSSPTVDTAKYLYDDSVDTSEKSVVVDWYYKKYENGKQVLHYVKYCNDVVLFATENQTRQMTDEFGNVTQPSMAERGLYDHGKYPFVFDPLYTVEGTPAGFGYIDIGKDSQEYIDKGNRAILKNMLANAKPRYFINTSGGVNEKEYADTEKDFIHVDGQLGQDSVLPVQGKPLNNIYVEVVNNKIDELKETTGNRDISTGGTASGVTAASAIAAMQEAGSKLSRDNSKAAYRAYKRLVLMVIELIRQFYDLPRCFRIMGDNGAQEFITYTNGGIQPQKQEMDFGLDMGDRMPLFDIEVTAQKQSPYSKLSQNELALQFYGAGFFNPQLADQALACIDMMDFDRKEIIMQKISQNGTMYQTIQQLQQQLMSMAQLVDAYRGGNETTLMTAQQLGMDTGGAQPMPGGVTPAADTEALGNAEAQESQVTRNARQRVADSTSPT